MNTFEIVTALTIGAIGSIILLYFIVLKKKGWLTEEYSSGRSYLCPNPQCRKVFEKPITLTDLSTIPPQAYLGCPHCGLNLETVPMIPPKKVRKNEKIVQPKRLQLTTENPTLETAAEINDTKTEESSKSSFLSSTFKSLKGNHKKREEKKHQDTPKTCSHFFGYVKTLPKNTPIPDECMWCTMIVKCLTGTEKIEA